METFDVVKNGFMTPYLLLISTKQDNNIILFNEEMYSANASELIFKAYKKLILNG
jgi:hypothetical protein